jgi:hypothetical protein
MPIAMGSWVVITEVGLGLHDPGLGDFSSDDRDYDHPE